MSDCTTVARPYAKGIFESALDKGELALWSEVLHVLADLVLVPDVQAFINNPASLPEQQVVLLQTFCFQKIKESDSVSNLIKLLAANNRLMILPGIKALYEYYRAEQEKTLNVSVFSFSEISATQQQKLIDSLGHRLKRSISLDIHIDPSVLGGAVIRAGDLVIDGSVWGKLQALRTELTA
jgi:F-type H+-transporting ATPase subunit delta